MSALGRIGRYLLVLALPVGYWVGTILGTRFLARLHEGTKTATYATFAGASGALLGFGLTAVTILFAIAPRTRLAAIVALQGERLRQFVTGTLAALAGSTVGFAILVPLGSQSSASIWTYLALALAGALITAVSEMVWLANRLFKVLTAQALDESTPASSWTPPSALDPEKYNVPRIGGLG